MASAIAEMANDRTLNTANPVPLAEVLASHRLRARDIAGKEDKEPDFYVTGGLMKSLW